MQHHVLAEQLPSKYTHKFEVQHPNLGLGRLTI
jgi:hypothetical protein